MLGDLQKKEKKVRKNTFQNGKYQKTMNTNCLSCDVMTEHGAAETADKNGDAYYKEISTF